MITDIEFQSYTIVSSQFPDLTSAEIFEYSDLSDMMISGLIELPEHCRVKAGALAVAHVVELMGGGCGVPLTGLSSVANDQDKVVFNTRSLSELESTKWGFMLLQVMRSCQPNCPRVYFGDCVGVTSRNTYSFGPSY